MKLAKETSILLIDDQQLLRAGIKQMIKSDPSFKVVAESNGEDSMIELVEKHAPDIVIMDINLRYTNWQKLIKHTKENFPMTKIIILTFNEDKTSVLKAVQLGVHGYVLKSIEGEFLIRILRYINEGATYIHHLVFHYVINDYQRLLEEHATQHLKVTYKKPLHILSRRECQVLQLLANGNSNKSIAKLLGISQSTCKNHVNSILKKMNVNGRTHAVVVAIRKGWVELGTINPLLSS